MSALPIRFPATRDTFGSAYCPGRVRRATDGEHEAVAAFVERHPQYARLSHLELVTLAATYAGPETLAERDALEDAGVPRDWHPSDDGEMA